MAIGKGRQCLRNGKVTKTGEKTQTLHQDNTSQRTKITFGPRCFSATDHTALKRDGAHAIRHSVKIATCGNERVVQTRVWSDAHFVFRLRRKALAHRMVASALGGSDWVHQDANRMWLTVRLYGQPSLPTAENPSKRSVPWKKR